MDLEAVAERFTRWLDEAIAELTAVNSVSRHIDELCSSDLSPKAQVDTTLLLFRWILASRPAQVEGKAVMLVIPLKTSTVLEADPPAWSSLPSQLSRTPPSIYVLEATALLQADPTHRYITPVEVPGLAGETVVATYQCSRHPDDLEEVGWARDVRVLWLAGLATRTREHSS